MAMKLAGFKHPFNPLSFGDAPAVRSWKPSPYSKIKGLRPKLDGCLVDATLLSAHDVASMELLEQIADALVQDQSAENMVRLEKLLRERRHE